MRSVSIIRHPSTDQGTFGVLVTDEGFTCHTLELPWRNNKRSLSCIPQGTYRVVPYRSARRGLVYLLENTLNRSAILIHSGNFAGDTTKGYKADSEGCILLGKYTGELAGQAAVLVSRPTIRAFMDSLENQPFQLTIVGNGHDVKEEV